MLLCEDSNYYRTVVYYPVYNVRCIISTRLIVGWASCICQQTLFLHVNIAVYKIDIWQVRHRFSCAFVVTIFASINAFVTSSAIDCDVITRTKTERARHGVDVWGLPLLSSLMYWFCHFRNEIIYVLSWWTVYVLTRMLFWCWKQIHFATCDSQ